MPDHAAFNVRVLSASRSAFIHVATSANSHGNYTDIDSTATNNKPTAILLVTPNWAAHQVYDRHPIGVWYHNGKWSIFNQDLARIPRRAAFNVQVLKASASNFIHVATAANSWWNYTDIDNPATNSRPTAIVFVTPNWAPHSVYNNHPIGVWYDVTKWSIFNQDLTAIPDQAAFNVSVSGGAL